MGSKEVMVGAPLIVFLYDRVFLAPSFREQWRQRWGLYVALAGTWLILARLVAGTHNPVVGYRHGVSSWRYLETQAGVIPYYLRLCFWPKPLVIDYYDWPVAKSLGDVWSGAMVVAALLGGAIWAFRRHPGLTFLGAWFFLILAPTSSFLPIIGEAVAERRMYLPLAAVVTMIVVGALGGFFVVPMNALLQHRGHLLMGAGHSIAVQNFNENLSILIMNGAYAAMDRSGMHVNAIIIVFGLIVSLSMFLLWRKHGHDQD